MELTLKRFVATTILACSAMTAAACASKTINQVLADPSRYRTREVQLSGSVTQSVSLGGRGAYRIEDRTGQLWVVSDRGTPREGAQVTVKGTVLEAFNFGGINLPGVGPGIVLMETSHKARD